MRMYSATGPGTLLHVAFVVLRTGCPCRLQSDSLAMVAYNGTFLCRSLSTEMCGRINTASFDVSKADTLNTSHKCQTSEPKPKHIPARASTMASQQRIRIETNGKPEAHTTAENNTTARAGITTLAKDN